MILRHFADLKGDSLEHSIDPPSLIALASMALRLQGEGWVGRGGHFVATVILYDCSTQSLISLFALWALV